MEFWHEAFVLWNLFSIFSCDIGLSGWFGWRDWKKVEQGKATR